MRAANVKRLCLAGVLTALVFVFTAFLHIPAHTGYVHIGDAFIYLAACLLPWQYAVFVGAGGALLADCLTGFAIWAPASVIIKAAAVLCFSRKARMVSLRNGVALVAAGLISCSGYFFYEWLLTGSLAPVASIPGNILQSSLSAVLFLVLGAALNKLNFKGENAL